MKRLVRLLPALAQAWPPLSATAACSRMIVVPVAPTGFNVIVKGGQVGGVFPDALRELGAKFGCSFSFPVVPRTRAASVGELLVHPDWRGVAVRSYVFGDEYNALMTRLEGQCRMSYAVAPLMVVRMMKAGRVDFTVVPPSIFLSTLHEDAELADFGAAVQFALLDGLPPTESGVCISRRVLLPADRAALRQLAARDRMWKWFQHY
jgi:polar amino acid transport system substrate-binding protein